MVGEKPSTKHYTIDENDSCQKGEVSQSYYHNSHTIPVDNLADLYEAILYAREDSNRYIIRGKGIEDSQFKIRRLKRSSDQPEGNFIEAPTSWICCDFDKYILPDNIARTSIEAIEWLIENELPPEFKNVSYIYQWSASAGLEYKGNPIKAGTNVHLFFWLDRGLVDKELEAWFAKQIESGFDGSIFRTITPIFVNSFVHKDDRIVDIIPDDDKFGIVAKDEIEVKVPNITIVPKNDTVLPKMDIDIANDILSYLHSIGAIYGRRSGWILLKHPQEKTPGNWHLKPNTPQVIHHHVKDSMRIDKWIKEFYGLDTDFKFYPTTPVTEYNDFLNKMRRKYG